MFYKINSFDDRVKVILNNFKCRFFKNAIYKSWLGFMHCHVMFKNTITVTEHVSCT